MFYQIKDEISKIKIKNINPEYLTVGMITLEELESIIIAILCFLFFKKKKFM